MRAPQTSMWLLPSFADGVQASLRENNAVPLQPMGSQSHSRQDKKPETRNLKPILGRKNAKNVKDRNLKLGTLRFD